MKYWLRKLSAAITHRELGRKLGPFAIAFPHPFENFYPYLDLLNLQDAAPSLVVISDVLQADDWETYAIGLLHDPNWRFHLVVGCALLFNPSERVLPDLWKAIDSGSWVAPQLGVVGYLSDPNFVEQAKSRIESSCPVKTIEGLSDLERHSATGPGDSLNRSAKNLATLLYLCDQIPELSTWCEEIRASPAVNALLKNDINKSAAITERWLKDIMCLFEERGTPLSPAYQKLL